MTYDGGKEDWEHSPSTESRSPLLDGDQLENLATSLNRIATLPTENTDSWLLGRVCGGLRRFI